MPRGRYRQHSPSERELDVMSVLWDLDSGTVAEVRAVLIEREELPPAYTTVLTLLRKLRAKRWVNVLREDRAHRFFPIVSRAEARAAALSALTNRYLDGTRESLLTHLVNDPATSLRALRRVRHVLDARLRHSGHGHASSSRSHG